MRPNTQDDFISLITVSPGCWFWQGKTDREGYGKFTLRPYGSTTAHRIAYSIWKSDIPKGLVIDHLCRVHNCVNPDHLEAVTIRENVLRGEGPAARQAKMTHCKRGHLLSGDNIRVYSNRRKCMSCING